MFINSGAQGCGVGAWNVSAVTSMARASHHPIPLCATHPSERYGAGR